MRARYLLGFFLLAGCGGDDSAAPTDGADPSAGQPDGFLRYLPAELSVTVRLPTASRCAEAPAACGAILEAFGHEPAQAKRLLFGTEAPNGIDTARAPGLALTTGGDWTHYLPAADKAALNLALRARAAETIMREEGDWLLVSNGPTRPAEVAPPPLPPGDAAVRVQFHPLLDALAQPTDALELGITLGTVGCDLTGRLLPGAESETRRLVAHAPEAEPGLLDLLPASLTLRFETTLPAPLFATFAARRLVRHAGVKDATDARRLERLLREGLTGVDAQRGIAAGFDFRDGQASVVLVGRIAPGPPSPILAKLRSGSPPSYGGVIFRNREAPRGSVGLSLSLVGVEPSLEGAPESAWGSIGALAGDPGLNLAYHEQQEWFTFAAGPRADRLCSLVRRRLASGGSRSAASLALQAVRDRARGRPYLLGIVFDGRRLDGMAAHDRAALTAAFSATPNASAPTTLAIAGFRGADGELALEGRAFY